MARRPYLPDRGDLAWINFEPQVGRKQAKNRTGLILTEKSFNRATGLVIACPVTRTEPLWFACGIGRYNDKGLCHGGASKQILAAILDMTP